MSKDFVDRLIHNMKLAGIVAKAAPWMGEGRGGITTKRFGEQEKWETLLGEFKRRMKKDKTDYVNHQEIAGNLYAQIRPHLK